MSYYDKRLFTVGGRTYEWTGGFGAIIKSYERAVKQGDLRVIGGETLYAHIVYPSWFGRSEVCWSVPSPTIDRIRELQNKFFGCGG